LPTLAGGNAQFLLEALRANQESMNALQRLQEQTAALHVRFLENAEAAQQSFQSLIEQQQRLFGQSGSAPMPAAVSQPFEAEPPVPPTLVKAAAKPSVAPKVEPPASTEPSQEIHAVVLAAVSESTGYPTEMLQLDMDMESDLGIDSIKRVEILSALQEKVPNASTVKPEHLGTLRTLRQIASFLVEGEQGVVGGERKLHENSTNHPPASIHRVETSAQGMSLTRLVLRAVALDLHSRRPQVRLDVKLPIFDAGDSKGLGGAVVECLRRKGYQAETVSMGDFNGPRPVCLGGLITVGPHGKLGAEGLWDQSSEIFLKEAFRLVQSAGSHLRNAGKSSRAVFMTVSRLDGAFGLRGIGDHDPVCGGLSGLSKTASHEWPEVACKALDVSREWDDENAALEIVDEMLLAGPLEVGLSPDGRKRLELVESALPVAGRTPLSQGDVVIVTGGARGVTAEAALALAQASRPLLILLGRTMPFTEPEWLKELKSEAEIMQGLLSHASDRRLSPKGFGEECRRVMANREIARNIGRIEEAGSKVIYTPLDVRNGHDLSALVQRITRDYGPVKGLIHGAGVLADKLIESKTQEQFDSVFDTKVSSLRHLLETLAGQELKFLVLFSSSTARFGRTGQADYAMANEVLNKVAQSQAMRRSGCRVVSVNWGPWDGGMMTPSLKRIFESEGVGVIGLEAGSRTLAAELGSSARDVEVCILGAGTKGKAPELRTSFERSFSLEQYPFLRAHVINGQAVLPAAVIVEWLGHGALNENAGLSFHGFEELRIFKGVRLKSGDSYGVKVLSSKAVKNGDRFEVPVELRGEDEVLHASAKVILVNRLPKADSPGLQIATRPYPHELEKAYSDFLFHGEELRGIKSVVGVSDEGIVAEVASAPPPRSWIRQPLRDSWLADPMALDCAFQAMILWSFEKFGQGSLPSAVASYRQFQAFPKDGIRIMAKVRQCRPSLAVADIEFISAQGELVARMEGYECTIASTLNEAFKRNALEAFA
jgi:NAD(P)-dependent dehydrogenase (short-subunit alcohol dehydrogenase family)